ncbi:heparinase II/III domain-containing protein [Cerasicoccus fimbriatus]|uniref:heparinase II/III domain-containing protein n=1 Tax=Cerasicoccus fimbriatus TaxID=3014554 RepID=UPI0022B38442|nr:heparinase II/III family protein [Cerasicoccus sp. TK19100]
MLLAILLLPLAVMAAPDWVDQPLATHPRLFLNEEIIKTLKANATGREADVYQEIKARVDRAMKQGQSIQFILHEGILVDAAIVAIVSGEEKYRQQAIEWLGEGIDHVEKLYAQRKALGWFSFQRMGLFMVYDWLYGNLTPEQRRDFGKRLMAHVEQINSGDVIPGENRYGFPAGGFYGTWNLFWYAGLTLHGEGIDDAKALEWIRRGYDDYQQLAEHRRETAGDDGGLAAPVYGYAMGAYPRAEWNFLHTVNSAYGRNLAAQFDYLPMLLNWVTWSIIVGEDGLYDYGYGDSHHTSNRFTDLKDVHLQQMRFFFQEDYPEYAQLAQYLAEINPSDRKGEYFWGDLYPLLLPETAAPVEAVGPDEAWPQARHFEEFGQFFMRSGFEPSDTYILFIAGAKNAGHKHFDEGHFTIFKQGFQAVDTGTRDKSDAASHKHITEYYNRTIAHNTLLIKMPDERFPHHWGKVPQGNDGGQNKTSGSEILSFQTNEYYTNIVADLTPVYSPKKVTQVIRQFLYLPPNHVVILDRVSSKEADYPKTWLLHTQTEPVGNGRQWSAQTDSGVMHVQTLLPTDAERMVIGGPGREFEVEGVNYPLSNKYIAKALMGDDAETFQDLPLGHWRVEVSPGQARESDVFLHVIEVGDRADAATMAPVDFRETAEAWFLKINQGQQAAIVRLSKTDPKGGGVRIERGGDIIFEEDFDGAIQPQQGIAKRTN